MDPQIVVIALALRASRVKARSGEESLKKGPAKGRNVDVLGHNLGATWGLNREKLSTNWCRTESEQSRKCAKGGAAPDSAMR